MRAACILFGSLSLVLVGACGAPEVPPPPPKPAPRPTATLVATAPLPTSAPAEAAPSEETSEDEATPEDAERVLFLATDVRTDEIRKWCPVTMEPRPRIRCLVGLRFGDEPESRKLALTLYAETGSLAGLLPEETSEDGRGGKVHLLPARPIGKNRDHLEWILEAFRDYKVFLDGIRKAAAGKAPDSATATTTATATMATPATATTTATATMATPATTTATATGTATATATAVTGTAATAPRKVAFRDRPVDFRFFYSEKGGNPSAFAVRKNVGYNLYGTVNVSDAAVRDTLFHEIFHLNDARLGAGLQAALQPIYDKILARCGKKKACLTPYAPTDTFVNGALYAFSLPTSPKEYAAEIGLRYYREHRLVLKGEPLPVAAFKCGPPENQEAYRLVADTMFGGVDLVAACPAPAGSEP